MWTAAVSSALWAHTSSFLRRLVSPSSPSQLRAHSVCATKDPECPSPARVYPFIFQFSRIMHNKAIECSFDFAGRRNLETCESYEQGPCCDSFSGHTRLNMLSSPEPPKPNSTFLLTQAPRSSPSPLPLHLLITHLRRL
ncbi:uncharacterized protein EI97DRAFT_306793 [Westerdykella ornata]|uniref:Uncharacterized protein n=1 Tax=Westerdykella ornata TaxID=318751 RepID=A0A6A6JPZ5_WESOR|nr:uncharacterized protein EI97DRAFT_306793 [Westerdykella ornata]KAF2277029.1 hypothetical protein EI97DRAFT_306793 [Westerdykella ornata]